MGIGRNGFRRNGNLPPMPHADTSWARQKSKTLKGFFIETKKSCQILS